MWFDDSLSLQMKSNLAVDRDLAGIGIWALSYEAGRQELWKGLRAAVTGTSAAGSGVTPDAPGSRITGVVPDPVRHISVIKFSLSDRCRFMLSIYNTDGRLMAVIADRIEDPGLHDEILNAGSLAPGIYICVLNTPEGRSSMKFAVTGEK
jgi:hypothetical protein